jgi:hypothetical protein
MFTYTRYCDPFMHIQQYFVVTCKYIGKVYVIIVLHTQCQMHDYVPFLKHNVKISFVLQTLRIRIIMKY